MVIIRRGIESSEKNYETCFTKEGLVQYNHLMIENVFNFESITAERII